MANVFSEIEDDVLFDDNLMFDEVQIEKYIMLNLVEKLDKFNDKEKGFAFEEIIYDFLSYINLDFTKTKKTRDFGIDGIIKLKLDFFGEMSLGLQIKYKIIDSMDVDLFVSALKRAELHFGVIICKDSRNLNNYELDSKIKAILISRGIKVKEKLLRESIDISPVFVLKFEDVVQIVATQMRAVARMVYKR